MGIIIWLIVSLIACWMLCGSPLLGTIIWVGVLFLTVIIASALVANDQKEVLEKQKHEDEEIAQIEAEIEKIPVEYRNFNNRIWADLAGRRADILLKRQGIDFDKFYNMKSAKPQPIKSNVDWTEDDWIALAITQMKFRD